MTRDAATASGAALGVSYVVTLYNKRAFVPQMVAGLGVQRGPFAREFVFIDDGSTDGSAAEVERLTAGWPEVRIITQANHGASHATNRGMEEARLPFIKLVDGDDVLLPDATACLLDALLGNEGAVLAFGETVPYCAPQDALAQLSDAPDKGAGGIEVIANPLERLVTGNLGIGPSNSLLLTAAVRQAGGCDTRVFTQDYSLALRLAALGPFVALDRVIALYPAVAQGRVNDGGPQVLHDANLALAYFLEGRPLPPTLARAAIRRAAGRAYHWARRRQGAGFVSYWTWLRLVAELPLPRPPIGLVRRSCDAFTMTQPVRRGSA